MLPTARLMAGWQGCCYVTLMAVLSAFFYFGGNLVQYGSPPKVLLPHAISANESSWRNRNNLSLYLAPVHCDGDSLSPESFGCFTRCRVNPHSTQELRTLLKNYAGERNPSRNLGGINEVTGLSENIVTLSIDARCRGSDIRRLFELLQSCGIWRLKFLARVKDW